MTCPRDESEQHGRMLPFQHFSFAGFTRTRTHFKGNVLGSTTKQNCSHLCQLSLFHLSMKLFAKHLSLSDRTTKLFHVSPPFIPLSLMAMTLIQLSISSSIIHLLPVISGEGATLGSICSHNHHGTTSHLQLVPLLLWDMIPSQNFLGSIKGIFCTLSH